MRSLLCCLVLAFLVSGCAPSSVSHLPRQQWKSETPQQLGMRYLAFQYHVSERDDQLVVNAEVFPEISRLPDWASWYGELVISIYVADSDGKVLASKDMTLSPRPLNREGSVPVDAVFELGTQRLQPLYVAFGYRVQLTDAENEASHRTVVAEQALKR